MMKSPMRLFVCSLLTIALQSSATVAVAGGHTDRSARAIDLAVIGDVPYGADPLLRFPTLIDAINDDAKVRRVVHVGDIKSGSTECTDAWFMTVRSHFDAFSDPLFYAMGDNEWTDCHRSNNGSYDPMDRLDELRDVFFDSPGESMGKRTKKVRYQKDYPENQLWVESRVAFSVLHVVGSNNNLLPWFGDDETADEEATRLAEHADRDAANVKWLEATFAVADRQRAVGVALFLHADMWHPKDRLDGDAFDGHEAFVQRLAELAEDFDKPVLLVSGDSHDFRVDAPVEWFDLYDADNLDNVTQIIVDRSIEGPPGSPPATSSWLRLHVDPRSKKVFSWEEVVVDEDADDDDDDDTCERRRGGGSR